MGAFFMMDVTRSGVLRLGAQSHIQLEIEYCRVLNKLSVLVIFHDFFTLLVLTMKDIVAGYFYIYLIKVMFIWVWQLKLNHIMISTSALSVLPMFI